MDFQKFKNLIQGKTLEDLIEKIKSLDSYPMIEDILEKDSNGAVALQALVMLETLADKELHALLHHVSLDITFGLIAQKLTSEILEEKET